MELSELQVFLVKLIVVFLDVLSVCTVCLVLLDGSFSPQTTILSSLVFTDLFHFQLLLFLLFCKRLFSFFQLLIVISFSFLTFLSIALHSLRDCYLDESGQFILIDIEDPVWNVPSDHFLFRDALEELPLLTSNLSHREKVEQNHIIELKSL